MKGNVSEIESVFAAGGDINLRDFVLEEEGCVTHTHTHTHALSFSHLSISLSLTHTHRRGAFDHPFCTIPG